VVIWPESAVEFLVDREPEGRRQIAEAAGGAVVVVGTRRIEGDPARWGAWRNSLVVVGPGGETLATYDKHHLVPFGEYLPLRPLLSAVGLEAIAAQQGGFGRGAGPVTLHVPGAPPFAPQICYETIFPHEMPAERPDWIAQVTNDAWFGDTGGPLQHLAQARMRAIEQGLPLARAANTGISAVIGPYGRVVDSLPLGTQGFLDAALPAALPPTLYARTGDLPAALAALLLLGLGVWAAWRRAG